MAIERRRDRLAFSALDTQLPEVPYVGWTRPRAAYDAGLGPHTHAWWELCWLRRGAVDWWVGDAFWHVPQGHWYVTAPGEPHGAVHAVLERCELFWLQLAPTRGVLPGIEEEDGRALLARLRRLPARIFPSSGTGVAERWWRLLDTLRDTPPLARPRARSALHDLLFAAVDAATHAVVREPSPAIRAAQAHALARLHRDCPVGELARAAGLSSSRFHERFLAEVGETPGDWARQRRIAEAKRRLGAGTRPITMIARDLGFASSQYFATIFRRYVGVSPREYRRRTIVGD